MLEFRKTDAYRYGVALLELATAVAGAVPAAHRCLGDHLWGAALAVVRGLVEGLHRAPTAPGEARLCYGLARATTFDCVALLDTLERLRAVSADDAGRMREVLRRVLALVCALEGEARPPDPAHQM
jgi:hypothetical protein